MAVDALAEVQRLEAAIAALGETNPHAKPLKVALQAAKSRSKVPPVADRIEACKTFIERVQRRVVKRALEQKEVYVAEVEDAQRRLVQLQAEVAAPVVQDVGELQRHIDNLVKERDQLRKTVCKGVPKSLQGEWFSDGATDLAKVPPMPSDLQDLEGWLSNRNCELRNALEHGDATSIAKLGTLLSQGAALLASITQDEPMDGMSRSSKMCALIDEADSKRRCLENASLVVAIVESGVRNARYGLRGERVGEASHPSTALP